MKAQVVGLALLAGAIAVPVFAQDSGAPAAAVSAAPAQQQAAATPVKHKGFDPDEIVCRQEQVTDSHLGAHRVCMPWKDWEAQEEDVQSQMNQFSRQANPQGGGFGAARGGR